MHVGYIRVSTDDQNLSLQKDALLKYGDTLVVWKLDRLGRSLAHLISVITDLKVVFNILCQHQISPKILS